MKINELPEKTTATDTDYLLIVDADGITYKMSRSNFLAGITGSDTGNSPATIEFTYENNGDQAGLIYYLGTNNYTQAYVNPSVSGTVFVTASSTLNSDYVATNLFDRGTGTAHTTREQNANFTIRFVNKFQLTAYTVRARTNDTTQIPRNWKMQGSNDLINWVDLDEQINVSNFTIGSWFKADVSSSIYYNNFRFLQIGLNNVSDYYLTLGEIEFYGEMQL